MISLRLAAAGDDAVIAALLDTCFGPARRNRTAYRLRDGASPHTELCLVAAAGERLVGSVQLWPVALLDDRGRAHDLLLLGPLAVAPDARELGLGSALVREALARVDAAGGAAVTLIGDAPYYARFGFSTAGTVGWQLPGPVDRDRLLLRGGDALPERGMLVPARRALPLAA